MRARSRMFFLLTLLFTPVFLFGQCTPPPTPGVRICSPTSGSIVVTPRVDFEITPDFGTQIVKFIGSDNNVLAFEDDTGSIGGPIFYGIMNGNHHLVINAWDNTGKLYTSEVTFRLIGEHFVVFCQTPTTPGINFCTPPVGAIVGTTYPVAMAAKGESAIKNIRFYVDGQEQPTRIIEGHKISTRIGPLSQGNHTIAFRAWDTNGKIYRSTRVIPSTYTYRYNDCTTETPPDCNPGFEQFQTVPQPDDYVDNTFPLAAQISHNQHSITTMRVYFDNSVVAESHGPTLNATVENAPSGTHYLTLQAWDTKGTMYRVQYDVNINVLH